MFGSLFLNDRLVNLTHVASAGFFFIGAQFVLNNFTAAAYDTNVEATAAEETPLRVNNPVIVQSYRARK